MKEHQILYNNKLPSFTLSEDFTQWLGNDINDRTYEKYLMNSVNLHNYI